MDRGANCCCVGVGGGGARSLDKLKVESGKWKMIFHFPLTIFNSLDRFHPETSLGR